MLEGKPCNRWETNFWKAIGVRSDDSNISRLRPEVVERDVLLDGEVKDVLLRI